jgi:AraC-like DNA-binding protein
LNKCDTRDDRGLRGGWTTFQRLWRGEPGPALRGFVSHYWAATWDLRGQAPYRQLIVPFPHVHLSFGDDTAPMLYGVTRGHVVRTLHGAGTVFGVAFRAGRFRPWLGAAVSTLTDRARPARDVFGAALPRHERHPEAMRRAVEAFLGGHLPPDDPAATRAGDVVDRIVAEPDLTRVDELAPRVGLTVRRLQRLFAEHVGVPPKWVIRRYRLNEVTQRLAAGATLDWARLATELGYADQAHLTRDFTEMVGEPPTRYAERYP